MNWLDLVLLLIVIFSTLTGLRNGLFIGLARIIGLILSITMAFMFYRTLSAYFDKQWECGSKIAKLIVNHFSSSSLNDLINKIPYYQDQLVLDVNNIAYQLAIKLLDFFSFILILILVSLVVKMVMGFCSSAISYTFLSPLDSFGGFIFGFLRGVIVILVISLILEPELAREVNTSQTQVNFIICAAKGSLIIPYALQLLNILNLHLHR